MKPKFWYIKQRHNPQLGVYHVALGNISQKEARAYEKPLYGDNLIIRFSSEAEYQRRCRELEILPK